MELYTLTALPLLPRSLDGGAYSVDYHPYYEYTLSEHDPPEIRDLKTYEGVLLAGKAFYFENGTNLLHPGPGQLIPIPEEEQNRHDAYKDMFVWE